MNSAVSNFSYQKLRNEQGWFDDEFDDLREKVIGKQRSFYRFRKVHIRRKLKIRIPRFGRILRRKVRLINLAWVKVIKRLKESQSHFGDLFAGNYMFMQVNPTPLKFKPGIVHKSLHAYSLPPTS
ncbi:hypothetical protein M9H77_37179 [Catharanthus roseus]|uniref:Uncharacterized protein n=1 Tax=Catharanthus roseus TaxID=4058 RepID=A0ACB9ZUZ4_CATRO|nr:hypothetical protein M9H77_37179 [Catharanthus roseus]